MPRFTDHARRRFVERRPDLFPPGADPPHPSHLDELARESYSTSSPVSRADVERFLGHRIGVYAGDIFYLLDRDQTGVWVAEWLSKGNVGVRTFIAPGEDPQVALHVMALTGVAGF